MRVPRGRPDDAAPHLRARRRGGGGGRGPGGLPRPRRVRQAVRRRGAGRAGRRRSSTRSARSTGCAGWPGRRCATSSRTARCTTRSCTTRRRPPRSSRRSRDYSAELPVLGLPGLGVPARGGEGGAADGAASSSSTAATPPRAPSCPARRPGALLHDPVEVTARVLRLVADGVVAAVDGSDVAVTAESACVHGDSPGAVEMARAVRAGLARRPASRVAGVRMKVLPFGDAALLVEVDGLAGGARAGRGGARRAAGRACSTSCPAARTVLVAVGAGHGPRRPAPGRPGPARRPCIGAARARRSRSR